MLSNQERKIVKELQRLHAEARKDAENWDILNPSRDFHRGVCEGIRRTAVSLYGVVVEHHVITNRPIPDDL